MIIAAATPADATAIGIVHVLAWHKTYRGIVPDPVLASLDPRERAAMWTRVIAEKGGVFVLREGSRIVGFVDAGPNRDSNLDYAGMIGAIYILSHAQRHGHGRALMAVAARHLHTAGLADAVLWVAAANTAACRFYESLGGIVAGEVTEEREGWTLPCVAYGWRDLAGLMQEGE